jgi:MFS family permease
VSPTARLVLALTVASAFSAFPSAYYHRVAEATGSQWATAVLFVAHGIASVLAMSLLTRPGPALHTARIGLGRAVPTLLILDAIGALLLVLAPDPAGVAWLLAGRVVTGAALGALTPLVTAGLSRDRSGTVLATAAILGGVGLGSLLAGVLAEVGLTRTEVFATGLAGLLAAAVLTRRAGLADRSGTGPTPAVGPVLAAAPAPALPSPMAGVVGCVVLAFAANGVLGLFTSTLPGFVAAKAGGAELVAGATAGLVMLAAGAARLTLLRASAGSVRVAAVVAAVAGAVLFAAGSLAGAVVVALLGGMALGAAAGVGYDTALRTAADRAGGIGPVAEVQRGGQLGLILPVLVYPLVVR